MQPKEEYLTTLISFNSFFMLNCMFECAVAVFFVGSVMLHNRIVLTAAFVYIGDDRYFRPLRAFYAET